MATANTATHTEAMIQLLEHKEKIESEQKSREAKDPFNGQSPSFNEYSKYRETGDVPEKFKAYEEPKKVDPPATEKVETVEGKEPSETEQVTQEKERDEKGKFKAKEPLFNEDQQKAFDRAFAKREAKLRAEFDAKLAAQTSSTTQDKPPAKEATKADTNLPPAIPNINNWQGTLEEFDKAIQEYPAKLKAYLDAERNREEETRTLQSRLAESEAETKEAHPDYPELFNQLVADIQAGEESPLPQHILKAIAEDSENAHELSYYLAKNREEYQRLAAITDPVEGLKQVLKLDARIQNSQTAKPPAKEKTSQTKAPAPPEPVGARASTKAFDVNDESLSADEWAKQRNKQLADRR